jgi:cytochrome c553
MTVESMVGASLVRGQPSFFVVAQLFLFREGRRDNAAMVAAAKGLTNSDLTAFADRVTKLPPPPPPEDVPDPARFARGRTLTLRHPCGVCHNPDFSGREQMPRLANQREDYLLKSMREYKSGARLGYGGAMAQDGSPAPAHGDRSIAPAEGRARVGLGVAVHLERALREIHDPVVDEAGAGVEAALVLAVQSEAGVAHLDHEYGPRGVAGLVVTKTPGHHGQVRLWFGLLIEREWPLAADFPASAERGAERLFRGPDGGEVATALRLGDDELPAEQLDGIPGPEEARLDQAVVLDALPAPGLRLGVTHAPSLATRVKPVNVSGWRHPRAARPRRATGTSACRARAPHGRRARRAPR